MEKSNHPQKDVSPARISAWWVIQEWGDGKKYAEDLLAEERKGGLLSSEDRRLAETLVYGVLRNLRLLDFWINKMAKAGIDSLPEPVVNALRLGLFQLAFLDRVPAHAAVDESVRLCELAEFPGLKGLVNALLRRYPEKREKLDRELKGEPNRVGILTSHPDWLVEWSIHQWGGEKAQAWLAGNNVIPRTYLSPIKTNLGESAIESLKERLDECEVLTEYGMVALPAGMVPGDLPALRDGYATVQDPSARRAVALLDPKPGERILDLCSAPGGKTIQIADQLGMQGEILSVDSNRSRLDKVRENVQRCGFKNVRVESHDLLLPWEGDRPEADGVLLDAPCSGLGTIRRRVDLRYRITERDIKELASKAQRLLENAAPLVRPRGRLVYSTCTLTVEENQGVVRAFLEKHPEEWILSQEELFPGWLAGKGADVPQVLPDCDASYCALLVRGET